MVLKLYGFHLSTCTRTVATVLHEKEVPFQFIPVDITKGEQKAPEYLAKHPFGQVPYIDDDGYVLYESRAIARYIATKYADQGTPLLPKDPKAYGLYEQAASVEAFNFHPYASKAVAENVFKKLRGLTPDPAVYEAAISTLDKNLDAYNTILGKQKYLAGNEITLADIFHVAYGSLVPAAGSNVIESKPNVDRWFKEVSGRASWQAVKDGVKSTA
jgi:glutathione S-transferase